MGNFPHVLTLTLPPTPYGVFLDLFEKGGENDNYGKVKWNFERFITAAQSSSIVDSCFNKIRVRYVVADELYKTTL